MSEPETSRSLWTGPADDPQRYRVETPDGELEPVGDGGEGLVFHASTGAGDDERPVALKLLTTVSIDQYETLAARSRSIAAVEHPHLMRQIEVFVGTGLVDADDISTADGDVLYSVAEWVPGTPFPDAVADVDLKTALEWVCQIAEAVQALHDHRDHTTPDGIVHRDVKPTNIRVTPDGQAVLIDYGIARPHDELEYTKASGTYGWRPPELLGGPGTPGPPIDAWGIGAVAYWTILGTQPPLEEAAAARIRLTTALREPFGADAPHIATHIANLLEANPDKRPGNLTRWASRLRDHLARRRVLRRRTLVALAVVITACALTAIGVGLTRSSEGASRPNGQKSESKSAGKRVSDESKLFETSRSWVETYSDFENPFGSPNSRAGRLIPPGETVRVSCKVGGFTVASGNPWWYRIVSSPWNGEYYASADGFIGNGNPPIDDAVPTCHGTLQVLSQTTGEATRTWTDYRTATAEEGPGIDPLQTLEVTCKTVGRMSANGNTWWYMLASDPWDNRYYAPAASFYNNGLTSGPLEGSPFVDFDVPTCDVEAGGSTGAVDGEFLATGSTDLRTSPTLTSARFATLRDRETVRVECVTTGETIDGPLGPTSSWYRIWAHSIQGYVSAQFVSTAEEARSRGLIPQC